MDNFKVFNNSEFGKVRVLEVDGKFYAVGVDVARALEYANPTRAIIDHCKGRCKLGVPSTNQYGAEFIQETNVIPESDIYRLIIKAADQSRNLNIKEKAARFEKWIFEEVLTSIRRHGAYFTASTAEKLMNDPDTLITLLNAIKKERLAREELQDQNDCLQAKLESDRPKVLFADSVSVSNTVISIADLAKILKGNGVNIGQKRLFERLREDGFLIRREGSDRNSPTQRAMNLGLFRIKETAITRSNGTITISKTSKVTGRGQEFFVNYFLSKKEVCHAD